jgi:hypothetical protein
MDVGFLILILILRRQYAAEVRVGVTMIMHAAFDPSITSPLHPSRGSASPVSQQPSAASPIVLKSVVLQISMLHKLDLESNV